MSSLPLDITLVTETNTQFVVQVNDSHYNVNLSNDGYNVAIADVSGNTLPSSVNVTNVYQVAIEPTNLLVRSAETDFKINLSNGDGLPGPKGDTGLKGDTGPAGADGTNGTNGTNGIDGAAGAKGDKGDAGLTGDTGAKGDTGDQGIQGIQGITGDTGSKGDKGDKGDTGLTGDTGPAGADGTNGTNGTNGADGPSAYQVAVTNGFTGTEAEWLASLVGAKGDKGDTGLTGDTGAAGANGTNGIDGAPGPTYTAGTGIDITGNVITNTGSSSSFDQSNVAITGGSISGVTLSTPGDITVSGMTVGFGGGNNPDNAAFGNGALSNLTAKTDPADYNKSFNVGIGTYALGSMSVGSNNVAIGSLALWQANDTTGAQIFGNMSIGPQSLHALKTGDNNIAIGAFAGGATFMGNYLEHGSSNIFIGTASIPLYSTDNNCIVIGQNVGKGSNTTVIGTTSNTATYLYGTLYVNDVEFTGGTTYTAGTGIAIAGNVISATGTTTGTVVGPNVTIDFGSFTTPALEIDFGAFV